MSLTLVTTSACSHLLHRETPAQPAIVTAPPEPADTAAETAALPAANDSSAAEHETAPPEAQRQAGAAEALVLRANAWLTLSREAQRQEFLRTETLYQQSGSLPDLIDLALLAALRNPERTETMKRIRNHLRSQIEQSKSTEENDERMALARSLLQILDERERLMGQLTSQNETLQNQLNELKAIEEQLRDRSGSEPMQTPP